MLLCLQYLSVVCLNRIILRTCFAHMKYYNLRVWQQRIQDRIGFWVLWCLQVFYHAWLQIKVEKKMILYITVNFINDSLYFWKVLALLIACFKTCLMISRWKSYSIVPPPLVSCRSLASFKNFLSLHFFIPSTLMICLIYFAHNHYLKISLQYK